MNKLFLISCLLALSVLGCKSDRSKEYTVLSGATMGTSYTIKADIDLQSITKDLDSLLAMFNHQLNTYDSSSIISQLNENHDLRIHIDQDWTYLIDMLLASSDLHERTNQYFDPSIMPLVNYWGFGSDRSAQRLEKDSSKITALLDLIGYEQFSIDTTIADHLIITKNHSDQTLDFSAIAKGYAVDLISGLVVDAGAKNYMVEIGGELYSSGQNPKSKSWTFGINTPKQDASLDDLIKFVQLDDRALATSGNYRNYYDYEGARYSHIINPKTGYPDSKMLSASVIASDCKTADAWATALTMMPIDLAVDLMHQNDLSGILIQASDVDNEYLIEEVNMKPYLVQ